METVITIIGAIIAIAVGWRMKHIKEKWFSISDRDFSRFKPDYKDREAYRRVHGHKMDDKEIRKKAIQYRNKADEEEKRARRKLENENAKDTISRFMRGFTGKPDSSKRGAKE